MRIENAFIPVSGVGEKTERTLWRNGITRWEEFEDGVVGDRTSERIGEFIRTARQRLDDGDARFFADRLPSGGLWRVYRNFESDTCFFDIETTGLDSDTSDVTTVSLHRDGDTRTLVRGRDLTRDALARELAGASVLVSFNGKRFDQPFLESNFDLDIDTPHLDLLYPCRRLDLTGGLKRIERDLGIGRDGMDVDGREAVRLWRQYEAGDQAALERLVRYNRHDAENLRTLLEHVHDALHDEVFATHLP